MLRRGFTILELLLVIAILGTIIAVVMPNVGVGLDSTRLATASRSLIQASKYARTMALLHQAETELILTSAKSEDDIAVIEVKAVDTGTISQYVSDNQAVASIESSEAYINTNASLSVSAAESFSEQISSRYECEGITFSFEGYNDSLSNIGDLETTEFAEGDTIRLRFKSNGQCRPFSVKVSCGEDFSDIVSVDVIGKGKVEGIDDEE